MLHQDGIGSSGGGEENIEIFEFIGFGFRAPQLDSAQAQRSMYFAIIFTAGIAPVVIRGHLAGELKAFIRCGCRELFVEGHEVGVNVKSGFQACGIAFTFEYNFFGDSRQGALRQVQGDGSGRVRKIEGELYRCIFVRFFSGVKSQLCFFAAAPEVPVFCRNACLKRVRQVV